VNPSIERHAGKYYGKYAGTVTKVEDDKQLGRIWVKVPSVLSDVEIQARPCFPEGHFWVPPVKANVWVEFEAGDPRYAIWTGVWYSQNDDLSPANITPPLSRLIKTPKGHTVEILDKDGEEKIVVRHEKKSFLALDKEGSALLGNDQGSFLHLNSKDQGATLMEQHGNLITMNSDGVLIVNSSGVTLEIKGSNVRIIASGTIQLSGNGINLQGNVAIGNQPQMSAVMAELFVPLFMSHVHATAMGPTLPPTVPILPQAIGTLFTKVS
jgi:hypothetical protein